MLIACTEYLHDAVRNQASLNQTWRGFCTHAQTVYVQESITVGVSECQYFEEVYIFTVKQP